MHEKYKIFIENLKWREGKWPFETCKHKWEENIIIDLKGTTYQGMDWIKVFQERIQWWADVKRVMKLQVKEEAWKLSDYKLLKDSDLWSD